jgi:asparagine synthase (glutamine-hydrolysing)
MCGIAGVVVLDEFDPKLLASMTHLVNYRGPDGYGFAFFHPSEKADSEVIHNEDPPPRFTNPVVGLGNRQLAILDLSALGDQPMQTEEGDLCITYNGEIYNYLEVREELVQSSIPALLHYEDRNSMAHSVETRLSFLDYELAEY